MRILLLFPILMALLLAVPAGVAAAGQFDPGPELDSTKDYYAFLQTSEGNLLVRLYADQTPRTVRNFVNLAEGKAEYRDPRTGRVRKAPMFDGLKFHKVLPERFIMTGDPRGDGKGGPGYVIPDEILPNVNFEKPGLLAMANVGPNTGASQFFITEVVATYMNQKHTIFGEVLEGTDGLDIVRKIARVERDMRDAPRSPVLLKTVRIIRLEKGLAPQAAAPLVREAGEKSLAENPPKG